MTRDQAQAVALRALAHIAADDRALSGLMVQTGIAADALTAAADDPQLLAGVLDYLLADECLLLEFCAASALSPETPARARAKLPGAPAAW